MYFLSGNSSPVAETSELMKNNFENNEETKWFQMESFRKFLFYTECDLTFDIVKELVYGTIRETSVN